eukprot:7710282-Ditylum_brightwellii.AAC.1
MECNAQTCHITTKCIQRHPNLYSMPLMMQCAQFASKCCWFLLNRGDDAERIDSCNKDGAVHHED